MRIQLPGAFFFVADDGWTNKKNHSASRRKIKID
jgi:hypothetical protein